MLPVGTANWQYILPNKTKARVTTPSWRSRRRPIRCWWTCFEHEPAGGFQPDPGGRQGDGRRPGRVGEFGDHLTAVPEQLRLRRRHPIGDELLRRRDRLGGSARGRPQASGPGLTQHVSSIASTTYEMLEAEELGPITDGMRPVIERLDKERKSHAGNKSYHTMVVSYFLDMARVWKRLRAVTSDGVRVCFVVGDSAPYGVHVPVDKWWGNSPSHPGSRASGSSRRGTETSNGRTGSTHFLSTKGTF